MPAKAKRKTEKTEEPIVLTLGTVLKDDEIEPSNPESPLHGASYSVIRVLPSGRFVIVVKLGKVQQAEPPEIRISEFDFNRAKFTLKEKKGK